MLEEAAENSSPLMSVPETPRDDETPRVEEAESLSLPKFKKPFFKENKEMKQLESEYVEQKNASLDQNNSIEVKESIFKTILKIEN
jgi:hypothetical protein